MSASHTSRQIWIIFRQGLRVELADRRRLMSPLMFAATFLVLFSFAVGDIDKSLALRIYVAESFLGVFFALEVVFSRIFEPDSEDRVFEILRTYPVNPFAWFVGKFILSFTAGAAIAVPAMILAALFNSKAGVNIADPVILGIPCLALGGMASLGVLLSTLTMRASSRQILYPILYFPLIIPVLLAAVQATLIYLETGKMTSMFQNWIGLLAGFDTIYFTLGLLLFREIVEPERGD